MSDRKYPFSAGSNSSESRIEKVLKDLERMVQLGNEAQTALTELRTKGHYDKPVVFLEDRYSCTSLNTSLSSASVTEMSFPKYIEPVIRMDLTQYGLELQYPRQKSAGGHPLMEYYVYMRKPDGTSPVQLGKLRVNKNTTSFTSMSSHRAGTYEITKRCKTLEATLQRVVECQALWCVASEMAKHMVTSKQLETQVGVDLLKKLNEELKTGGHVVRLLQDIVRGLFVEGVMEM